MGGFDITGVDDITASGDIDTSAGDITAPGGGLTVQDDIISSSGNIEVFSGIIFAKRFQAFLGSPQAGSVMYGFADDANTGMTKIGKGNSNTLGFETTGIERLRINSDGTLAVDGGGVDSGYAALLTEENDVPNVKYVDDAVAGVAFDTSTVPVLFFQNADPGGSAKNGDIWIDTNDVPTTYIRVNGTMRQIFPAVYS